MNFFKWKKPDGTEITLGFSVALVLIVILVLRANRGDLLPAIFQALHFHW